MTEKEVRYNYAGYRICFNKEGKIYRYKEQNDGDSDD